MGKCPGGCADVCSGEFFRSLGVIFHRGIVPGGSESPCRITSLRAVVVICATVTQVNIDTHPVQTRSTFEQLHTHYATSIALCSSGLCSVIAICGTVTPH